MTDALTIPAFFNGPPTSGNGGYTCGRIAELLGGEVVEVSLRSRRRHARRRGGAE